MKRLMYWFDLALKALLCAGISGLAGLAWYGVYFVYAKSENLGGDHVVFMLILSMPAIVFTLLAAIFCWDFAKDELRPLFSDIQERSKNSMLAVIGHLIGFTTFVSAAGLMVSAICRHPPKWEVGDIVATVIVLTLLTGALYLACLAWVWFLDSLEAYRERRED